MTKVSASVAEAFVPSFKVFSLPYLFPRPGPPLRGARRADRPGAAARRSRSRGCAACATSTPAAAASTPAIQRGAIRRPISRVSRCAPRRAPPRCGWCGPSGGSATPIAWGELYTALQQGVVDGAENNPPSFYLSRHYEVCRYYSLDEHTSVPGRAADRVPASGRTSIPRRRCSRGGRPRGGRATRRCIWPRPRTRRSRRSQRPASRSSVPTRSPFDEAVDAADRGVP